MNYSIPFNKPSISGREFDYIRDAIAYGHISGDGGFSRKCQELLKNEFKAKGVLLTTSCTHALEMSALLLDIKPGDEILVPSYTFVSTINAFVIRGARPVFVDIRKDTLNLDESEVERHLTSRTKAIIPVHYAGVGCEMDAITGIAAKCNIPIVEDNAHGFLGKYKGKFLGTFGTFATLSFHETKNFTCGEGGALIVYDQDYLERAEIIREKGTNRSRFFRGQVDKYSWVDVGSSYLPSDMLAAFLYAQLECREKIQQRRKQIWNGYYEGLKDWAEKRNVGLPVVPPHCEQAYHMFYLVMLSLEERQSLILHLKSKGIMAVFHYLPLHLSKMGRRFGGFQGQCPVTENISDRLLRLPFYNSLRVEEQAYVISAITEFVP